MCKYDLVNPTVYQACAEPRTSGGGLETQPIRDHKNALSVISASWRSRMAAARVSHVHTARAAEQRWSRSGSLATTAQRGDTYGQSPAACSVPLHPVHVSARSCRAHRKDDDDDEPEVYYAQLMHLVASEAGGALQQNRESSPAVDRVGQPWAKITAQMDMDSVMSRACRRMKHLYAGACIHG
jgi:hypothetical protein